MISPLVSSFHYLLFIINILTLIFIIHFGDYDPKTVKIRAHTGLPSAQLMPPNESCLVVSNTHYCTGSRPAMHASKTWLIQWY